ncbi:MAG: CCA tRNA nucleotidyltransferase [Ignavibacteria bacterium]
MKLNINPDNTIRIDNKIILRISDFAQENKFKIYLVGGFVRDTLLGLSCNDIDICVLGDGVNFAEKAATALGTRLSAVYKNFGTALLETDELKIEFASTRAESYSKDSRKPRVEPAPLDKDLSRRDFTINAMAVSLNKDDFGSLIDIFNGLEDIKNKILRTPLEPSKTFDDDPLRILRCIRFASQFNFEIESTTFEAIKEMKNRLKISGDGISVVSKERITDEFLKTLMTPKPSIGLGLMQKSSVMSVVFPEVSELEGVEQRKDFHHKDVFYHTMQVLDNISTKSDNVWLRFASLMHDIAKPATKKFVEGTGWTFHGHEDLGAKWQKKIFERMKLPFDKLPYVEKLVRLHLRPIALAEDNVTDSAIRRIIFEAGDEIFDLMTLCRADITSKDAEKVKKFRSNFDRVEMKIKEVEDRDRIRNFQSPVRGGEIMDVCGLSPSRTVGIIKHKIEEAILDGIIPNEYDAALKYLYEIKDEVLQKKG